MEEHTVAWVSQEAKDHWENKISIFSQMISKLEIETVVRKIRDVGLVYVPNMALVEFIRDMDHRDLTCLPIQREGDKYRVAISRSRDYLKEFQTYWGKNDLKIGDMLGYPRCCCVFFNNYWNYENKRDTILGMNTDEPHHATSNILLRTLGVRPVFHLPCSFHCKATKDVAHKILNTAGDAWGLDNNFGAIYDILNWPIRFSALHGIVEIITPVLKIRRETDYTANEVIIDFQGVNYPAHGARGLRFPFRMDTPSIRVELKVRDIWSLNGFPNKAMMDRAHNVILTAIREINDRSRAGTVFDLGCGNGYLLKRIVEENPNLRPFGVDSSLAAIEATDKLLENAVIVHADINKLNFNDVYDIGLISIHRIEEAKRSGIELLPYLQRWFKNLIVYDYDSPEPKIVGVYHGQVNVTSEGPSSPAGESGSDSQRNGSNPEANEGSEHRQDSGGTIRFVPDWAVKSGQNSDES